MIKRSLVYILFILLPLFSTAQGDDGGEDDPKGDEKEYRGLHIGLVSGGGVTLQDGVMQSPAPLNFNLEVGFDFGNQLDVIGRLGYSPLTGTGNSVIISGTLVTPPSNIHIFNYDFGIRYIPFPARFSPYFAILLGVYSSKSDSQGTQVFNSQIGFHNVQSLGLQFHASSHHLVGFELASNLFLNERVNLTSLLFNAVYRYTF